MHISALPSEYGIGDFGQGAYQFADFLHDCGQSTWQILPLNPTSAGVHYSPYSSFSAFALNRLLISPDLLVKKGWLTSDELLPLNCLESKVAFEQVSSFKEDCFDRAFENFTRLGRFDAFEEFQSRHSWWLDDYALFKVLNACFPSHCWNEWPEAFRKRDEKALSDFKMRYRRTLLREKFIQFIAFEQWQELSSYCASKGITFFGDLPLYLNYHSVEVWSQKELFKLDPEGRMISVAGVPPDYFSEEGQLWGNPLYNWKKLEEDDFSFWMKRLKHNLELFGALRIDHFRGLVACWEVPATEKTAIRGEWVKVPVEKFMDRLYEECGEVSIIAEDLGVITDDVKAIMKKYQLPGMKVLLFAFFNENADNPYLPYNIPYNSIVYTGTHDNNTILGWYNEEASEKEIELFVKYSDSSLKKDNLHWDMISMAMATEAKLVIVPIQDVLGLDEKSRFNIPGVAEGNWLWRMPKDLLTGTVKNQLTEMTQKHQRWPK